MLPIWLSSSATGARASEPECDAERRNEGDYSRAGHVAGLRIVMAELVSRFSALISPGCRWRLVRQCGVRGGSALAGPPEADQWRPRRRQQVRQPGLRRLRLHPHHPPKHPRHHRQVPRLRTHHHPDLLSPDTHRATTSNRPKIFNQFDGTQAHFQNLTMRIPSTSDSETYRWLGTVTQNREWDADSLQPSASAACRRAGAAGAPPRKRGSDAGFGVHGLVCATAFKQCPAGAFRGRTVQEQCHTQPSLPPAARAGSKRWATPSLRMVRFDD